ncbi:Transposable element Tcb1 transposase [Brachionus plicatilis]|uniref:Transposable element Tcb1 transposase n=1 Tax=Brachionus plicatilis TaxID=10195 RepID=A0A3M7S6P4_BRAPC|nr:Transposable element Tcb1 transposase [Brachionus plicatilis]
MLGFLSLGIKDNQRHRLEILLTRNNLFKTLFLKEIKIKHLNQNCNDIEKSRKKKQKKSNIDAILYREILSDYILPFGASNYDLDFKLHPDNDPKHRYLLCTTFLNFYNIVWIKFPPKSPDLNPIKLMWNELKQHVRKRMILSEADAEMATKDFEKSLTKEKCQNYINHLKVIKVVIERNGDWSNFLITDSMKKLINQLNKMFCKLFQNIQNIDSDSKLIKSCILVYEKISDSDSYLKLTLEKLIKNKNCHVLSSKHSLTR